MEQKSIEIETQGETATRELAQALGAVIHQGCCIGLDGELGSGKTRFVQGLAKGLGIDDREVASPTFVLCHVYSGGRLPLYHYDAYRITDLDEFWELGVAETLADGAVVIVEWSDKVTPTLAADRLQISFEELGPDKRRICLSATGDVSQKLLDKFAAN